ncbi:tryptophan--tRNA ligase [Erysipelotrichaceae bacterium OH741_COT-311]|nr:tryptophan--tRNA ligase [Erysipelotrichaceae bacterium OH741_COT-311]
MKTMVSGIKPTGQLHLGNYLGALKNFVTYQDDYHMIAFIANLHCITVYQDPKELQTYLKDCIALYLACGLDPDKATIFLQTDVLEHAQLGFILNCNTYLGELNRMTQYKDKVAKNEINLTGGIYTYPTLMAADILMYDADYVPVGDDQKQHVELTRDVAIRFNNRYGETFKVPEPIIPKTGARIMSLSDPSKKMSKSDESNKGCIYLLDDLKIVHKKIMSAVTDDKAQVKYDVHNQPGIANLMTIYASLTGKTMSEIEKEFEGQLYGNFKKAVSAVVCDELAMIQEKYRNIVESNIMDEVLLKGKQFASKKAQEKLDLVQKKIGIEIR